MVVPEEGHLLRVFIGEADKHEGKPLYEWLVKEARRQNLAGVTVLRGMMGFGPGSRIYTSKILRLSEDLPIIIELVDSREKLETFLKTVDEVVVNGMATLEKVQVHLYRAGK
jgi:PII-like signaling protein